VFDPNQLGEVVKGMRAEWNVKPASRWEILLPGLGEGRGGNGPYGNVGGATYDSTSKRLYLHGFWLTPNIMNRIYVYDVNC